MERRSAGAQALELDFIPLFQERYDLVIPAEYYESDLLAPLWDILGQPGFCQGVASLPGYDTSRMGELVARIE